MTGQTFWTLIKELVSTRGYKPILGYLVLVLPDRYDTKLIQPFSLQAQPPL